MKAQKRKLFNIWLVNKQNVLSMQWKIIQTWKWMMHRYILQCNEPRNHYAKWKKPNKRLVRFHRYEMQWKGKFIATESRLVVATDCGDNKGWLLIGEVFCFRVMKVFWPSLYSENIKVKNEYIVTVCFLIKLYANIIINL